MKVVLFGEKKSHSLFAPNIQSSQPIAGVGTGRKEEKNSRFYHGRDGNTVLIQPRVPQISGGFETKPGVIFGRHPQYNPTNKHNILTWQMQNTITILSRCLSNHSCRCCYITQQKLRSVFQYHLINNPQKAHW